MESNSFDNYHVALSWVIRFSLNDVNNSMHFLIFRHKKVWISHKEEVFEFSEGQ